MQIIVAVALPSALSKASALSDIFRAGNRSISSQDLGDTLIRGHPNNGRATFVPHPAGRLARATFRGHTGGLSRTSRRNSGRRDLSRLSFPGLRGIADRAAALPAPFLPSSVFGVKLVSSAYILESKVPRGEYAHVYVCARVRVHVCVCVSSVYVWRRGGGFGGVTGAWRAA